MLVIETDIESRQRLPCHFQVLGRVMAIEMKKIRMSYFKFFLYLLQLLIHLFSVLFIVNIQARFVMSPN